MLRLENVPDEAIFDEAIAVLDVERLETDAAAIATALEPGSLPLEYVRAACTPPTPRAGGIPWQAGYAGYALARDVRQRLGLDGEPLPSIASLGEALRENPDALAAATQRRDFGGADLVNGVVATPALLTRAQSDRQQRSRAFAAEFLAPAAALQARVPRPVPDEEDVEELAAEFGVSPLLISHQLENHQIARIR